MAMGSTELLVKISTRNIRGGKGGRCVRLTTSTSSCAECREIWEIKPPGTLWATPGRLRDCFSLLVLCVCVCVFVCVSTVSGVFIYSVQKGKWLSVLVRKDGTILSTQLSPPNFDTKH